MQWGEAQIRNSIVRSPILSELCLGYLLECTPMSSFIQFGHS